MGLLSDAAGEASAQVRGRQMEAWKSYVRELPFCCGWDNNLFFFQDGMCVGSVDLHRLCLEWIHTC